MKGTNIKAAGTLVVKGSLYGPDAQIRKTCASIRAVVSK